MSYSLRKCGDCRFYSPWPGNFRIGRCLLFDSTSPQKRKLKMIDINVKQECYYSLSLREKIPLTRERIAQVLNKAPQMFHSPVQEQEINLNSIKKGVERFELGLPL